MQHLIVEMLEGHADLVVEGLPAIKGLSIRFDPQRLCIEVWLSDLSPVVGELSRQFFQGTSPPIRLTNVVLRTCRPERTLRANELVLYPSSSIKAWPAISWEPDDTESRRLELRPSSSKALAFVSDELISKEHPYQVYYGGACTGFQVPRSLRHPSLPSEIFLHRDHPMPGVLRASSAEDFFAQEPRIHAAWRLLHGQDLPWILKVSGREVHFHGDRLKGGLSYLPAADPNAVPFMSAVLSGFLELDAQKFGAAHAALRFHIAGKQADLWLEGRFMLLMTCVEAMDGVRDLDEDCTVAMLGVDRAVAKLLNCLRNKFMHGAGGYEAAFAKVLEQDFKKARDRESAALREFVSPQETLDFVKLLARLCERLDAFWCAYLGVSPDLEQRYSIIGLMPPVDRAAWELAVDNENWNRQRKRDASTSLWEQAAAERG